MRPLSTISALIAFTLAGCASVPSQIAGTDFAALTPQQAVGQNAHGARVRWGGEIIRVDPKPESTCFEVLSRELYSDARPSRRVEGSGGRFIACSKGFYDPAVYVKGRDLTVTGMLAGTEQHPVGDFNYTYARVDADNVYLWPQRSATVDPFPYYYDPWGPWAGPWGWWGAPPVVIMREKHH